MFGIVALLLSGLPLADGVNDDKPIRQDKVVYLYPDGQGAGNGIVEDGVTVTFGPVSDNGNRGPERIDELGKTYDIGDKARMELYFPKNPNGLMVIVCPGGSYAYVGAVTEGYCVAEWLLSQGCTVGVMFYRPPCGNKEIPLADVQNAMRYCRYHAAEWGISKVGVMGSSAGGHLAASAAVMHNDAVTRPDFSILLYPVIMMEGEFAHVSSRKNLLGEEPSAKDIKRYSLHRQVSKDTPETFIALSSDDNRVPMQHSLEYFAALRVHDVRAQMHVYPKGGHGWGFGHPPYSKRDKLGQYRHTFESALSRFLAEQKQ